MSTQFAAAAPRHADRRSGSEAVAPDDLTLAALLSSRICHDLVGPIGALGNGIEFVQSGDQGARDHAMRIIADGTAQARAKLQFYRAAFGYGGSLGDTVRQDEMRQLTEDYLAGGRVRLDWRSSDQALDRALTRLTLNLALIGIEALPRGGVVRVGVMRKAALNILVMAEGASIKFSPRVQGLFSEGALPAGDDPVEPKEAPILLAHRLGHQAGASLSFQEEDGRLVIAATL